MQKLNYPLNDYIKAVEILVARKGFASVQHFPNKGSVVRFELFLPDEEVPTLFWVIHHEHSGKKHIRSKEDYKKAARKMNATLEEFEAILCSL